MDTILKEKKDIWKKADYDIRKKLQTDPERNGKWTRTLLSHLYSSWH